MPKKKWSDEYYVIIYQLARDGHSNIDIAQILDVSIGGLNLWIKEKPAVKDALTRGRQTNFDKPETLIDYVYGQMPEALRQLWQRCIDMNERIKSTQGSLRQLTFSQGTVTAQHLYATAVVYHAWDESRALGYLGLRFQDLQDWHQDTQFVRLIQEMEWHRKNMYEGKLTELVMMGHAGAVLFVNKTKNKDRGYGETLDVAVTGEVDVTHHVEQQVSLDDLMDFLPASVRVGLLDAMRQYEEHQKKITLETEPANHA